MTPLAISEIVSIAGLVMGSIGAIAAAFVTLRKAPAEVELTEAQQRKLAAETELLVTENLNKLRAEVEELRQKLAAAERLAEIARQHENEAQVEVARTRQRIAELEAKIAKLHYELDLLRGEVERNPQTRTRHEDS